jgi:bacteriorhodopsin
VHFVRTIFSFIYVNKFCDCRPLYNRHLSMCCKLFCWPCWVTCVLAVTIVKYMFYGVKCVIYVLTCGQLCTGACSGTEGDEINSHLMQDVQC